MGAGKGSAGRRGNRTLLPDAYEIPHFASTIKQESSAECGIIGGIEALQTCGVARSAKEA